MGKINGFLKFVVILLGLMVCVNLVNYELFAQEEDTTEVSESSDSEENSDENSGDEAPAEDSQENAEASTEEPEKEEEKEIDPREIQVQWYQPQILPGSKKSRKLIILNGKVNKKARVYIPRKHIPTVVKGRVRKFPTKKAFKGGNKPLKKRWGVTTDKYGDFQLKLELPRYAVQLPIRIYGIDKSKSNLVLKLYVQKDEKNIIDSDQVTPRLAKDKTFGIWAGFGMNFLNYRQETDIESELEYSSIEIPSAYARFEWHINRRWDVSLEYTNTPGKAENDSSNSFTSLDEKYNWTIIDVNGHYYPRSWEQNKIWFDKYADFGIRFGFQSQQVPFIETAGASPNLITIEQKNITYFTAGFFMKAYDRSNWVYEIFMRYQHPVAAPSDFTIGNAFGFDGSVGAYYLLNKSFRMGLFWYGQYQNYDFSGLEESFLANREIDGTQTLLFSNVEFRVGYEF